MTSAPLELAEQQRAVAHGADRDALLAARQPRRGHGDARAVLARARAELHVRGRARPGDAHAHDQLVGLDRRRVVAADELVDGERPDRRAGSRARRGRPGRAASTAGRWRSPRRRARRRASRRCARARSRPRRSSRERAPAVVHDRAALDRRVRRHGADHERVAVARDVRQPVDTAQREHRLWELEEPRLREHADERAARDGQRIVAERGAELDRLLERPRPAASASRALLAAHARRWRGRARAHAARACGST